MSLIVMATALAKRKRICRQAQACGCLIIVSRQVLL